MRQVNVFNGDCAYTEWRKTGLPGEVLVWRENYLRGMLPATDNLTEFNQVRAAELHKEAPDKTRAEIFAELEGMHRTLLSLCAEDRMTLWFDVCPFDRVMLARILYLLSRLSALPQIELICFDVAWDKKAFQAHLHDGVILDASDLNYGKTEWLAFVNGKEPDSLLSGLADGHP